MTFADVLVPVPIMGSFTYKVPAEMTQTISVGHRVIVPFGRKKFYTGIVTGLSNMGPEDYEVKDIASVLDNRPIVRHPQLKFWQWVADYYLCTPGEVMRAAMPAGLKVESETFIMPNPDYEEREDDRLTPRELAVMELLLGTDKKMPLDLIGKKTGFANMAAVANALLAKEAVMISENLVERYRSRKETYVRLKIERGDTEALHKTFDSVKCGGKQEKALLALIELSGFMRQGNELNEVTRTELIERAGVTTTIVAAMAKKGIVEIYTK